MTRVAIVHDYLTQRGGAERVVLAMHRAFPDAPIYTSLYSPTMTFPDFAHADIRTSVVNRARILRRHHRLAFPILPIVFSQMRVDADVVFASSSGWAHGAPTEGRKIVYCHTPARWLYQRDRYIGERRGLASLALRILSPWLIHWDKRAAATASAYLTQSRAVAKRIQDEYSVEAELLPAPPGIVDDGVRAPVSGLTPGYHLCVSRLMPYKNVDQVVAAFASLKDERLVVLGRGPLAATLRANAGSNVQLIEHAADAELRWLYGNCRALIAASYEDFGLTPIEAASFGKPSVVLEWGGFLDTVRHGETGTFFSAPEAEAIAAAVKVSLEQEWNVGQIISHASRYEEERFIQRLQALAFGGEVE